MVELARLMQSEAFDVSSLFGSVTTSDNIALLTTAHQCSKKRRFYALCMPDTAPRIVQTPSMPSLATLVLLYILLIRTSTQAFDSQSLWFAHPSPFSSPSAHIPPCSLITLRCFSTASLASKNLSTQFCIHDPSFLSKPLDEMLPVTHFFQQMSVSSWTARHEKHG